MKVILDSFSSKHQNIFLIGDFNLEPIEETMGDFIELYHLKNLVRVHAIKILRTLLVLTFFLETKTFASRKLMLLIQDYLISINQSLQL